MDTRTLYGQRGRSDSNLQTMADYFWMRCVLQGEHVKADNQQTYLLANLCPSVRSSAAQRILPDARPRRGQMYLSTQWAAVSALEELLRKPADLGRAQDDRMTMSEFHQRTRQLLMPRFDAAQKQVYRQFCGILFGQKVRKALMDNPAGARIAVAKWMQLNKRFGRHSDRPLERSVLDTLSYQSTAAVRRCYAFVWNDLIPHLARQHRLNWATLQFLRLMHLEHLIPTQGSNRRVSLFHGHIFALHPAMSMLMYTPTGQQLMGQYVRGETAEECLTPFQKLLWAIYLSL
jgi:hypothetical protein